MDSFTIRFAAGFAGRRVRLGPRDPPAFPARRVSRVLHAPRGRRSRFSPQLQCKGRGHPAGCAKRFPRPRLYHRAPS
jgi:hypothetical protein